MLSQTPLPPVQYINWGSMCVIQQTTDPESTEASESLSPSLSLITLTLISCLLASFLKIKYATVINNNTILLLLLRILLLMMMMMLRAPNCSQSIAQVYVLIWLTVYTQKLRAYDRLRNRQN